MNPKSHNSAWWGRSFNLKSLIQIPEILDCVKYHSIYGLGLLDISYTRLEKSKSPA